jgi:HEAT repeat protein
LLLIVNARRLTTIIALCVICVCAFSIAGAQVSPVPGMPASVLAERFKTERSFTDQFEIVEKLVKLHDTSVLEQLKPYLKHDDRHIRGNAAYVFAALGDDRGFDVLKAILMDRSERPEGQGIPGGNWTLPAQISADRYYAVHLFGDLKDVRAVGILVPLLHDPAVDDLVPWALGEIGDRTAIPPIMQMLTDEDPDLRVLAIDALETMRAKEALPQLRLLLHDGQRIHFDGLETVAEAARAAITRLEALP